MTHKRKGRGRRAAAPDVVATLIAAGRISRERACDEKVRFNTAAKAMRSAEKWRLKEGADLIPYACPFCLGFHLTSPPKKEIVA